MNFIAEMQILIRKNKQLQAENERLKANLFKSERLVAHFYRNKLRP